MVKMVAGVILILAVLSLSANAFVFYPECVSPNAKTQGIHSASSIVQASLHAEQPVVTNEPGERSSAIFALINFAAKGLPENVLRIAFKAYQHARALGYDSQQIITVVDYHLPSDKKRLWVLDLKHGKVLLNTYVSHGTHSGGRYAHRFSNALNSHESSLGVMLTEQAYEGQLGYSLRLQGLEPQFNGNVYQRDIVVHPATYVDAKVAKKFHQVGESFGCLAVSDKVDADLINLIKSGTIIVDYYPDRHWLMTSNYLH